MLVIRLDGDVNEVNYTTFWSHDEVHNRKALPTNDQTAAGDVYGLPGCPRLETALAKGPIQ